MSIVVDGILGRIVATEPLKSRRAAAHFKQFHLAIDTQPRTSYNLTYT